MFKFLQLESRMHRLERRMAVKRRRDVNEGYDEVAEEKDVKPVTPKKYAKLICDNYMGSRNGVVEGAHTFRHYCPGSIPTCCHMWVEFVVGSCLALSIFVSVFEFSSSLKTNVFKFKLDH